MFDGHLFSQLIWNVSLFIICEKYLPPKIYGHKIRKVWKECNYVIWRNIFFWWLWGNMWDNIWICKWATIQYFTTITTAMYLNILNCDCIQVPFVLASLPSHLKWPDNFIPSLSEAKPSPPPLYNLYLMSVLVMVTISQCVRQYLPLDYYKNPDLYRMYRDWLPAYCWCSLCAECS